MRSHQRRCGETRKVRHAIHDDEVFGIDMIDERHGLRSDEELPTVRCALQHRRQLRDCERVQSELWLIEKHE